jgi:hypothetical protein
MNAVKNTTLGTPIEIVDSKRWFGLCSSVIVCFRQVVVTKGIAAATESCASMVPTSSYTRTGKLKILVRSAYAHALGPYPLIRL